MCGHWAWARTFNVARTSLSRSTVHGVWGMDRAVSAMMNASRASVLALPEYKSAALSFANPGRYVTSQLALRDPATGRTPMWGYPQIVDGWSGGFCRLLLVDLVFVVDWAEVVERGVEPLSVVELFNPSSGGRHGLLAGGPGVAVVELGLER
jgi:hypothetical protein